MRNTRDPLVTIITPTYNRAAYLKETIESVLDQDYPRLDYLVLDDGSTDKTRELLQHYAGRLRWESHPNRGEQKTVNKGFSLARGEYVAVVNSDDPLRPGAVRAAVELLEGRPEVLAAYPDWDMLDSAGRVLRAMRVAEYDFRRMLVFHDCMVGPGAFVRRSAIERVGGRDPRYRFVADFDFWLRLGLLGPMARIPARLATWRTHEGAASTRQQGQAMAAEHVRLMKEFFARGDLPPEIRKLRRRALSWAHCAAAFHAGGLGWLRLRHVLIFVLSRPSNAWAWWRKTGREKPEVNRCKRALRRVFGAAAPR